MLADAAISRLVNARGAGKILMAFRLPLYARYGEQDGVYHASLSRMLNEYGLRAKIYTWWKKYLNADPPRFQYLWDLQADFVWTVNEKLFPIDLTEMDGLANSGVYEEAEPLDFPIAFRSFGVPWEMEAIDEFDRHLRPVIAAIAPLLPNFAEAEPIADEIVEWWEDSGHPMPDYSYITADYELSQLCEALSCQEPPLDGLAVAVECVARNGGNVFLDTPEWLRLEYEDDEFFWDEHDIELLTAEYARAKDRLARLDAYEQWFNATPDATEQVTRLLVDLLDREWFIQDGEVIFDDAPDTREQPAGRLIDLFDPDPEYMIQDGKVIFDDRTDNN